MSLANLIYNMSAPKFASILNPNPKSYLILAIVHVFIKVYINIYNINVPGSDLMLLAYTGHFLTLI